MQSVKYIFGEESETWQQMLWDNMAEEEQAEATEAWKKAEFAPGPASDEEKEEAEVLAAEEDAEIGQAMTALNVHEKGVEVDTPGTSRCSSHRGHLRTFCSVDAELHCRSARAVRQCGHWLSAAILSQPHEAKASRHTPHLEPRGYETGR